MRWNVAEPFDVKLDRLLKRIDNLHNAGYRVSLVGVSAGASAVVNAFAARQKAVHRVVCICGKLRNPQTIAEATYRRNPAFAESMQQLGTSLESLPAELRGHILSIRPLSDGSVPPTDTIVPGFETSVIPSRGHVPSIALGITLFSPLIFGFIRRP